MIDNQIDAAIDRARQSYVVKRIVGGWIRNCFRSNNWFATNLSNARFTNRDGRYRFTARATVRIGPDFDRDVDKSFTFTSGGASGKYKGVLS